MGRVMAGWLADASESTGTAYSGTGDPVLVVADHGLFSTALIMALRSEGIEARSLVVDGVSGLLHRPTLAPAGLVVLDLDLVKDPDGESTAGGDLVRQFRARGWKVLVVAGDADQAGIAAAVAAGAIGTFPKSRSIDDLLQTVITATAGLPIMTEVEYQAWVRRHHHYLAQERALSRRFVCVTHRESEVLELLAEGMRAAAIAEHFVVSLPTVRTHIRSILLKLQVRSQLEAVALWRQHCDAMERQGRRPTGLAGAASRGARAV